jgi:hypothetical protein
MPTIFAPLIASFAQSTYNDQMGSQLPGMLANAADKNMCDAATVFVPEGTMIEDSLCAGSFCILNFQYKSILGEGDRAGTNSFAAVPVIANTMPDFSALGVVVRTQQMRSNKFGLPSIHMNDMASIIRTDRIGARVWVWCDSDNAPEVGARTGYISQVLENNVVSYLSVVPSGGLSITGIIVHAVDRNCQIETNINLPLCAALIEFTTAGTDAEHSYPITI